MTRFLLALLLLPITLLAQSNGNFRGSLYGPSGWGNAVWTGSGLVGITSGTTPTTFSIGTGSNAVAQGNLAGNISQTSVLANVDSGLPFTSNKINSWNFSSSPPIRIANWGDSLSTGIDLSDFMSKRGGYIFGAGATYSGGAAAATGQFSYWLTGRVDVYPIGSSGVYLGEASQDITGDRLAIYYIQQSGGGSFDWQYSSDGGSSWTTAASINTSGTATIGVANVTNLSSSNTPQYRARVTNVTSGTVRVIGWGIYNSTGGGVLFINGLYNNAGHDLTEELTTPVAVINPIQASVAPDAMISCWADAASNWQAGGAFRTMYTRLLTAYASTDFLLVSGNPNQVGTQVEEAAIEQWKFAREFGEGFFDGTSIFRSYTWANSKNMYADPTHLNENGIFYRNQAIWSTGWLGKKMLGRLSLNPQYAGLRASLPGRLQFDTFNTGQLNTEEITQGAPTRFYKGVRFQQENTTDQGANYLLSNTDGVWRISIPGADIFRVQPSTGRGIYPGADGQSLGGTIDGSDYRYAAGLLSLKVGTSATATTLTGIYSGTNQLVFSSLPATSGTTVLISVPGATSTNVPTITTGWSGTVTPSTIAKGDAYVVASGTVAVPYTNFGAVGVSGTVTVRATVLQP